MISNQIIKADYIASVLERDMKNIYAAQLAIATQNVYLGGKSLKQKKRRGKTLAQGRDGDAIVNMLQNPSYSIGQTQGVFVVTNNIIKKLRFRDMKKYGNWKIYNRQVWGILYNNALPDIRYNVGNNISDILGNQLKQIFEQ